MKFINTTLNIALCLKKDMRFACQLEHHQRAAACEFLWGGGRGLSEIGQKTVTPHMLGYISEHTQQFWVTDRYLRCVCLCILCILTHLGSAGYRIMPSPSVSSGWDIIDQSHWNKFAFSKQVSLPDWLCYVKRSLSFICTFKIPEVLYKFGTNSFVHKTQGE